MHEKRCWSCNQIKDISEFHRQKSTKDGKTSLCKACKAIRDARRYEINKEKQIARAREWNLSHPERYKDTWLRLAYGISYADYQQMLAAQGGGCAICGKPAKRALDVDHDPATGRVRGLLCNMHNRGIGMFDHNIEFLRAAVRYLEAAQANTPSPSHTPGPEGQEAA